MMKYCLQRKKRARLCQRPAAGRRDKPNAPGIATRLRLVEDDTAAFRVVQACSQAFTLLEVMIAVGIFFMVAFTVLALVSQCLRQAGALKQMRSPVGSLAAQTVVTNQLKEGIETGDFEDIFPDHRWTRDVYEVTNGLYEVILTTKRSGQGEPDGELTLYLFRPEGASRRPGGRRR